MPPRRPANSARPKRSPQFASLQSGNERSAWPKNAPCGAVSPAARPKCPTCRSKLTISTRSSLAATPTNWTTCECSARCVISGRAVGSPTSRLSSTRRGRDAPASNASDGPKTALIPRDGGVLCSAPTATDARQRTWPCSTSDGRKTTLSSRDGGGLCAVPTDTDTRQRTWPRSMSDGRKTTLDPHASERGTTHRQNPYSALLTIPPGHGCRLARRSNRRRRTLCRTRVAQQIASGGRPRDRRGSRSQRRIGVLSLFPRCSLLARRWSFLRCHSPS